MNKHAFLPLVVCLLFASTIVAENRSPKVSTTSATNGESNWPQWRGPLANGVAPQADPPLTWDADTNVKWKAAVPGRGTATPIVWGERVFVLTAIETDRVTPTPPVAADDARTVPPDRFYQFVVLCFDRNSGDELWRKTAIEAVPHEGKHGTNTYASGSPTTDGERLYVSFGSRGLFCYDLDGNLLWTRDLGDARTRRGWGEASTPVVEGDSLIVNWDTEDESFITALDTANGEPKWKQDRNEPTGWTTPLVVTRDGKSQVIVNGTNRVRSYDLSTGKLIWECGGQTTNAIPSPVADRETLYVTSGYRGAALFALPLSASGDITGTKSIRWTQDRGTPYVPSPLLVDGRLYVTQANSNVLTCLDAQNGKTIFGPQRLDGIANIYASPVSAAGRIYFTGREGTTVVIKSSPHYEPLATNNLGEPVDASPVLVGNQVLLRSAGHLFCIEAE